MSKKAASSNKTFIILLCVAGALLIAYLGVNKYLADKKAAANGPAYPDNSALGVAYNFYQWYTSCMSEENSENPNPTAANCYKNTSYLTSDVVKALDKKQTTVLCNKDLGFHDVSVKEINTNGDTSHIEVSSVSTKEIIANTTIQQISGNWKITNISCN